MRSLVKNAEELYLVKHPMTGSSLPLGNSHPHAFLHPNHVSDALLDWPQRIHDGPIEVA